MGRKVSIPDKPDLPKRLFWKFKYDDIEWRAENLSVISYTHSDTEFSNLIIVTVFDGKSI